jgi:hypothetical protein
LANKVAVPKKNSTNKKGKNNTNVPAIKQAISDIKRSHTLDLAIHKSNNNDKSYAQSAASYHLKLIYYKTRNKLFFGLKISFSPAFI